jgi:hypothetical protein
VSGGPEHNVWCVFDLRSFAIHTGGERLKIVFKASDSDYDWKI